MILKQYGISSDKTELTMPKIWNYLGCSYNFAHNCTWHLTKKLDKWTFPWTDVPTDVT